MPEIKNKVQLVGRLGNKPEIRTTDKGRKYARFSIATNEFYKNAKGEAVESTYWHNIVAWGKVADKAEEFLNKGTEVSVEGKLVSKTYTDKEGNKRYITEVDINQLELVNSKEKAEASK